MGETVDSETAFSEYTESDWELLEMQSCTNTERDGPPVGDVFGPAAAASGGLSLSTSRLRGFIRLDARYLVPFFTRRFTSREVAEGRRQMSNLTDKWYREVRSAPSGSEDEQAGEDGPQGHENSPLLTREETG